jgi:hypothetical protein
MTDMHKNILPLRRRRNTCTASAMLLCWDDPS